MGVLETIKPLSLGSGKALTNWQVSRQKAINICSLRTLLFLIHPLNSITAPIPSQCHVADVRCDVSWGTPILLRESSNMTMTFFANSTLHEARYWHGYKSFSTSANSTIELTTKSTSSNPISWSSSVRRTYLRVGHGKHRTENIESHTREPGLKTYTVL